MKWLVWAGCCCCQHQRGGVQGTENGMKKQTEFMRFVQGQSTGKQVSSHSAHRWPVQMQAFQTGFSPSGSPAFWLGSQDVRRLSEHFSRYPYAALEGVPVPCQRQMEVLSSSADPTAGKLSSVAVEPEPLGDVSFKMYLLSRRGIVGRQRFLFNSCMMKSINCFLLSSTPQMNLTV